MATSKTTTNSGPPHAMGIPEPIKSDLLKRLARVRGQIEGIGRMVEQERYCPEVLQQFAAVHAALRGAERALLASHLERCVTQAIQQGGPAADQARQEIVDLLHRYLR